MSIIQIENLEKHYGSVRALDGLTLTVESGVVFGFLGPNGAGKSTTMRLLTGLAKPTAGQLWVAGQLVDGKTRVSQRLGYLPEDPAFYPWMTPTELLDHIGKLFSLLQPYRQKKVDSLLELVGLTQVKKRRIGGFSRGMRQRLGLAQALVNKPDVLLLDEPVSALDPGGRKEVLELIASLRGQSTVFMSTHILDDVERICDRVGIIHQGRLVVESDKEELLAEYSVSGLELELEPGYSDDLAKLVATFETKEWFASVQRSDKTARLIVTDIGLAREQVLPVVLESGIPLRRFEVVTPNLEEIFLRLTSAGDESGGEA